MNGFINSNCEIFSHLAVFYLGLFPIFTANPGYASNNTTPVKHFLFNKHNELNKKGIININFKRSLEFMESGFFRTRNNVASERDYDYFSIEKNFKF